jgi:RecB family exonuclease
MDKKKMSMSATRTSMFLQCKWKYWANYILHKPKLPNISFKLGISVHDALKIAGLTWQKKEKFTKYDFEKVKKAYTEKAAEEGIQDLGVYDEGMSMVLEKMRDFEVGKIISVEDKFNVTTGEGVPIIGAMDKVVELNEDTILVVDYKTSKFVYTQSEMKNDIQLSIYDVVANIKFPQYKRIILALDYLRSTSVYTYRNDKERKSFSQYLLAVYNEMLNLEEKDAKPSLNDMCNWCDFRNECPAYIEASKNDKVLKKKLEDQDEDELVSEYLDIRNRKRVLDNYEKRIKSYIIEKIKNDEKDLVGGNSVIYIRQNPSTLYDPKAVYKSVPLNDFLKMITVSKRSFDEYVEGNPIDKSRIMETATKNYTNRFLAVRNINRK